MRKTIATFTILTLMMISSCAAKAGDKADCPECNNETEILVGTKCVPIEEVDECGPDGHAHGDECHCFSSQEVSLIGERSFCLQQGCEEVDSDIEACDEDEDHEHEDHEEHEDHDEIS